MKPLKINSLKLMPYLLFLISVFSSVAPLSAHSADSINQLFDEVLQKNVVDGRVNYSGISSDSRFKQYISMLVTTPAPGSRNAALAYWINAYNALTIQGILNGKSPSSFLGRIGFFKTAKYKVNNTEINLYDLERDILIKMGEPRIHFAIVCASSSCPKLRSEAYTEDNLNNQLEEVTRAFINDTTRNGFDHEKRVARLSKIFDWFPKDFNKHSGSVLRYIAQYVSDPSLAKSLEKDDYTIDYLKYDWSLNGTPPTK